ncbi:hypothetical protein BDF20DRAFT_914706 [Mycotypha africana]|uniref:uncharacterized protein n=1 Tax=Mycotypha africana TaxID=64632 RepID=UPI002300FBC2|nr:uncharacterized protein BDF20DRAFT_914706 [Mycotypha africana]KAI8973233.1 hypothetical protein BDF20DRAFT_914706 [Mycotypha africana]
MKPVLGSLYERIRIHIETQRASATLLKLQNSGNDMYKTHNPSSFCSADSEEDDLLQFLKDVQQTSQQASALLDDLFFTSQSVHNMELRYLQHLAGTLALHHQNRINNEEAVAILTHILNKIELLLQEEVHHETEVTIKQQQLTVSSSSMKSTSCASSVSSWSSASNSVLSNDDTVDTAATAVTFGFSGAEGGLSSSPSANSGISVLVQKIEQALEKLRVCYRKQQQEKLMNGNNKRNPPISAAEEELARQRERSAHLVMELERSRSQRNLLMKDEKTIVCLKSQLQQEAKQRQSLIERIASLEALVNTSAAENTEQSKKMKEAAEEQIRKHKQEIEQQRERVAQLELHYQEKQKELTAVTDKYAAEKHTWTLTEQLILKKCNIVFDNDNESSSTDYKEAVTKLVDRYMAERQKVKSLNQQQKAVASKKEAEEKKAATAELEKQALLEEKQKIEHMKRLIEEEKDDIKSQRASLMKEKEFLKQSKQQIEKEKQRLHAERRTFEEEKLKFEMHKKVSVTANVDDNAGVMSKADSVKQLEELREAFRQAQHIYTTRESAFMLQSASTEAELERLLKEYDRLTRNIVDFNTERKKFEDEIEGLHKEKLQLEKQIADQQVLTIKESSLRKEFRELMSTVKDTHTEAVLKELGKQRQLEQELKDVKADAEMKRWDQVNVGVQTSFDFASTMMPFHSSTLLGNERSE